MTKEGPLPLSGGKAPIVQPNYALLSQAAAVHRGIGQRLLAELLQRLGVHILSSRAIKVRPVSRWKFYNWMGLQM